PAQNSILPPPKLKPVGFNSSSPTQKGEARRCLGRIRSAIPPNGTDRLRKRGDEVAQDRINLVLPFAAGKHAVMADIGLNVGALLVFGNAGAEIVRGEGLAHGANVVALAFDRQERGVADRARIDRPATVREFTERHFVVLENPLDGFEIE